MSNADKEAILRVFCKKKCDSGGAAQEECEIAANPDVKCQNSKYLKDLLLMLFFSCILLLLQLVIHVGILWGKILVSWMCNLGFQCYSLLQESHHLSAVCCGEDLGWKRIYEGLTLAVILLSGNLNFAYTGIWGINRKVCPITQRVQEQCWSPPLPLTPNMCFYVK